VLHRHRLQSALGLQRTGSGGVVGGGSPGRHQRAISVDLGECLLTLGQVAGVSICEGVSHARPFRGCWQGAPLMVLLLMSNALAYACATIMPGASMCKVCLLVTVDCCTHL
jgi:hypothetical protein